MDLELEKKPFPWKHAVLYILEFGFIANIILIDGFIVHDIFFTPQQNQAARVERIQTTIYITPTPQPKDSSVPTAVPIKQPTTQASQTSAPQVKEYYVPLGSGQSTAADWETVAGVQASVDSNNYPNIKQVVLEATVHMPNATQTVQVRLFDATDGHPVWYSDLSFPGSGNNPQLLISQPIILDSGNKLYTIQMKTQLQAPAVLDQARIHITLR